MKKTVREVKVSDIITYAALPTLIIPLLWLVIVPLLLDLTPISWIVYLLSGIATYFLVRRLAIGLVLVYKAIAPMKMREQCRFHPTCSTYMVMAINKYGLIVGVVKGIMRIVRCHPPNGGEDYP